MPFSTQPTLAAGDVVRATYLNLGKTNADDHEDRIIDLEALAVAGGDVDGPASATDNAIARFDSTTGKILQNSGITIADGASGVLSGSNTGDQTITLTGNVTGSGTGSFAATIANDAVTYAKIQNISAASRLLGRGSSSGSGDVEEITLGTGLQMTGNTLEATGAGGSGAPTTSTYVTLSTDATLTNERVLTGSGRVSVTDAGAGSTVTLDVPDGGITYAKVQDVSAASRILGRGSAGGSGDVQELTAGTGLTIDGTAIKATHTSIVGITIDGGGSVITTGVKGYLTVPVACTITGAKLLADQSGSIVVDVWKDTYANYPPVDADSITASAPPTLSTAIKSNDTTLTGWTTSITAGDVLGFNVDSVTTVTRVHVELTVTY
jgi:hypothetical protein